MASRFHPLMATIARVRSTSSFSVKCCLASSYTSSGTRPFATSVPASVQARAARSRSVKKGVSRQTKPSHTRPAVACESPLMGASPPILWPAQVFRLLTRTPLATREVGYPWTATSIRNTRDGKAHGGCALRQAGSPMAVRVVRPGLRASYKPWEPRMVSTLTTRVTIA